MYLEKALQIKAPSLGEGIKEMAQKQQQGGIPPYYPLPEAQDRRFQAFLAEYCPLLKACTVLRDFPTDLFYGAEEIPFSTMYRSTNGSAQWYPKTGEPASGPTEAQFTEVDNTIYYVRAALRYSNKTLFNYGKKLDNQMLWNWARLFGQAIQLAILNGAGSDSDPITGIYRMDGLTKDSYVSNLHEELIDVVKELKEDGINVNGVALSPREEQSLRKQTDAAGTYIFKPTEDIQVSGAPGMVCSELPVNLGAGADSFALAGDWRSAMLLMPGGLMVMKDPYSRFLEGETRFIGVMWFGLSIENISDFRCLDGIS